jgi:hypothetical protein
MSLMETRTPGGRSNGQVTPKSCWSGGIALVDVDAASASASASTSAQCFGGGEYKSINHSYWERLQWELRPSFSFFSIDEPSGDKIDVAASFGARSHNSSYLRMIRIIIVRLVCFIWSLQVFYEDVSHYPPHNLYIYMGYLTHWGHVLTTLYFMCSFLCTILPFVTRQPVSAPLELDEPSQSPPSQPHVLVRTTWGLYSTVAPLEVAITLLYWASGGVNDNGPVTYISVMEHGGLAVLVWMNGLIVSVVPVRAKHIWLLLTVCALYLIWSVVDVVAGIGGGEWGPIDTDDALYPVLRWGSETRAAALLSVFTICVLAPGLFLVCWMMSLASLASNNSREEGTTSPQCGGSCCGCVFHGLRRKLCSKIPDSSDGAFDYNGMEKVVKTEGSMS